MSMMIKYKTVKRYCLDKHNLELSLTGYAALNNIMEDIIAAGCKKSKREGHSKLNENHLKGLLIKTGG